MAWQLKKCVSIVWVLLTMTEQAKRLVTKQSVLIARTVKKAWKRAKLKLLFIAMKMIKYFFIVSLRNLLRDKAYLILNLLGLSIGIAGSILILLYVRHETSYDNFQVKSEEIYRINCYAMLEGKEMSVALTAPPQARVFMEEFPEIEDATRMYLPEQQKVTIDDFTYREDNFFYGDANFFEVFTFPFLKGDPALVLQKPFTVVLTANSAEKLFGTEDPIGKTIELNGDQIYEVTGVVMNLPSNSNFRFDYMASFSSLELSSSEFWLSQMLETFIVLPENADPSILESKFPGLMDKYVLPQLTQLLSMNVSSFNEFTESGNNFEYHLQPLSEIHHNTMYQFGQEQSTSRVYVYFFSFVAIFLLFIACINFMNLSTAKYSYRTKEVGIKKVVGSSRGQLRRQFIFESVIISAVAVIFALTLVEMLLPGFNNFTGKELSIGYFSNWFTVPLLIIFTMVIGLISGSYPAFYLSSFNPARIFKSTVNNERSNHSLRSVLVIIQFSITIILLISTFIVSSQIRFVRNKSLGFNKENIIVIENSGDLGDQSESFRQQLLNITDVAEASRSWTAPGQNYVVSSFQVEGDSVFKMYSIEIIEGDYDFVQALGIKLKEGRSFSREFPSDNQAILINEAAVKSLGLETPVGSRITQPANVEGDIDILEVVGVFEDMHYKTLHYKIEPMMIGLNTSTSNRFTIVKIQSGAILNTMDQIEKAWNRFMPGQPMEFFFLDDNLNSLYHSEVRAGRIFTVFSALAVFVACLGLLGLSAFTAEKRKKEIGIRKAHGASVMTVIGLLSREIVILIIISSAIAWPAVYLIMNRWLQNFAYQTKINPFIFVVSSLIGLLIAIAVVIYQSYRVATMNPVEALKYE